MVAYMEHVLQVNILWVTFVAGSVISLLTGLITKWKASSEVKSLVNLGLSVAAGVCTVLVQASGTVTAQQLVIGVFTTLTASGITYNHVWKPTGVADAVQGLAPEHGIGTVGTDLAPLDTSRWAMTGTPVDKVPPTPVVSEPAPLEAPEAGVSTMNLIGVPSESTPGVAAAQDIADKSILTGKPYLALITPVLSEIED